LYLKMAVDAVPAEPDGPRLFTKATGGCSRNMVRFGISAGGAWEVPVPGAACVLAAHGGQGKGGSSSDDGDREGC
jgi:hypothetical protein